MKAVQLVMAVAAGAALVGVTAAAWGCGGNTTTGGGTTAAAPAPAKTETNAQPLNGDRPPAANTNTETAATPPDTPNTTKTQTEKPKAAVYIMGNPEGRDALRMAVNTFLVKSGKYQMVAVDAIDVVAKEHLRQMSGAVSDEQIAKLGQDAGAMYVCVVERSELDGVSYVATRMISVESKVAEFADMVKLPKGGDVIDIIRGQIGAMLGMELGVKTATVATSAQPTAAAPTPQPVNKEAAPTVDASGTLTDNRDGHKYRTVIIGGKRWMAENLNINRGNSWCYNNDNSYCNKYGRLYDWSTSRTVCPAGFHLPSRQEWDDLVKEMGVNTAGKKLKATSGWINNGNGSDDYGFSALPGGGREATGGFHYADGDGYWWTATEYGSGGAYLRYMTSYYDHVGESYGNVGYGDKGYGNSVRCVAD